MIGYSESDIFTEVERSMLRRAIKLVDRVGKHASVIRCHELARAVGELLDLQVQDGFYGFVEHSWLWTGPVDIKKTPTVRLGFPHILDVYSVGRLPQVTLVAGDSPSLPHVGWSYRPGPLRTDLDLPLIEALLTEMRGL